jgi:peptide/histidine transporter 3/4
MFWMQSLVFVTMAVSLPSLKPPPCKKLGDNSIFCPAASRSQVGFFYFALYLMALGAGGIKSNVSSFAGDQFDEMDVVESRRKISFLNWWLVSISFGTMLSVSLLVYVEENIGWSWGYAAATVVTGIGAVLFFAGTPSYRHQKPAGSPLTRVAQVIVAAACKWRAVFPVVAKAGHLDISSNNYRLYEPEGVLFPHKSRLPHTDEFA